MTEYHPVWKNRKKRKERVRKNTTFCIFFWTTEINLKTMSHILASKQRQVLRLSTALWTWKLTMQVKLYKLHLTKRDTASRPGWVGLQVTWCGGRFPACSGWFGTLRLLPTQTILRVYKEKPWTLETQSTFFFKATV